MPLLHFKHFFFSAYVCVFNNSVCVSGCLCVRNLLICVFAADPVSERAGIQQQMWLFSVGDLADGEDCSG